MKALEELEITEVIGEYIGGEYEMLHNGEGFCIQRCIYGSEVLCTDNLMILDIDYPVGSSEYLSVIDFIDNELDFNFSLYKTAGGLRLIVSGKAIELDGDDFHGITSQLPCDPIYIRLCLETESYRARLTPKPERVGLARYDQGLELSDKREYVIKARAAYLEEYNLAINEGFFITAELITVRNNVKEPEEFLFIIGLHDNMTGARDKGWIGCGGSPEFTLA